MSNLLCAIFGHRKPQTGQHIAYRGLEYQWRCSRCDKLAKRSWESHAR
jgi:hypothetical protein